jgi:hypothetical protein
MIPSLRAWWRYDDRELCLDRDREEGIRIRSPHASCARVLRGWPCFIDHEIGVGE